MRELRLVTISTEIVVEIKVGDDLGQTISRATNVAESSISSIDEWDIDVGDKVTESKQLPEKWEVDCYPWGGNGQEMVEEIWAMNYVWGRIESWRLLYDHRIFRAVQFDELDKEVAFHALSQLVKRGKLAGFGLISDEGGDLQWRGPLEDVNAALNNPNLDLGDGETTLETVFELVEGGSK